MDLYRQDGSINAFVDLVSLAGAGMVPPPLPSYIKKKVAACPMRGFKVWTGWAAMDGANGDVEMATGRSTVWLLCRLQPKCLGRCRFQTAVLPSLLQNLYRCPARRRINGSSPAWRINGSSPARRINGSSPPWRINGSSPAWRINGSSPHRHGFGISF